LARISVSGATILQSVSRWRGRPKKPRRSTVVAANDPCSPQRSGRPTQQIEARLLFVSERVVEFRERRLHGPDSAQRGFEPLFHRLDPTRGSERLVARAIGLKPFRRLECVNWKPPLTRLGAQCQICHCQMNFRCPRVFIKLPQSRSPKFFRGPRHRSPSQSGSGSAPPSIIAQVIDRGNSMSGR
jgi:hypothetical protein